MTKIKPFKALIYNQEKFKDLSRLVCPPYDVISASGQQYYHDLSPYNLIHMLLGKDIPGEDKYRRAGACFKEWTKNKILVQEPAPAVYFYLQEYSLRGERKTRMGIIALLRLEEGSPTVFAHENTRQEAKEDRLKLLRQVKANLSPIFAVFADKKRVIQHVYQHYVKGNSPLIEITDPEKTVHKLWRIDSPELLTRIQAGMENEYIFIADGHHRHEVARLYREEMVKKLGVVTGEEGFQYLMCYFTNVESKGLTILPIHRLVKLKPGFQMPDFIQRLRENFDIDDVKDGSRFFFLMQKAGHSGHILGMYRDRQYRLIRLKNLRIMDKEIPDKPKEYRMLDVSILNQLVLKTALGLDPENKADITFSPDAAELIEKVDSDSSHIAFFLNPVSIQQIIAVASTGNKMPPKSTYFYPKVLSGMVINKL